MLLATFCQDWSAFGWPVAAAIAIGVSGAMATGPFRISSPPVQGHLRAWLPLLMLACCISTRLLEGIGGFGFFRKCYYAQLDFAFIVSFAFGTGFMLGALRERHRLVRAGGCLYLPAYVWLFIQAVRYTERMYHWWEGGSG